MKNHIEKGFSTEELRKKAVAVVDLITSHLEDTAERKTIDWKSPADELNFWQNDFDSPMKAEVAELFGSVMERSVNLHSPKYMGHQVATTLPITAVSSALIAYLNQGMPVYEMAMAGNAMEQVVMKHLCEKLGFDRAASGVFTSGGSLANLTALLTARARFRYTDFPKLAILVSSESHYSIARAATIMGLAPENIIEVPVNDQYQMKTELLDDLYEQAVSEGKKIMTIVACACSTALGAYDDLDAIGKWANARNVWLHVDGAHGAAVIYSRRYKHLINGIERADSVILDFHKLLLTPSLLTAVIYKKGANAKTTFAQNADYIFAQTAEDDWYNSGKRTIECTKPMNILHVYSMLRIYGEEIFEENVDRLYDLSREFAEIIEGNPDFELATKPESNIVCFRYSATADCSAVNRAIYRELLHQGEYFIVNTTIAGEFWLRVSIQNPLTGLSDLRGLVDRISELAGIAGLGSNHSSQALITNS